MSTQAEILAEVIVELTADFPVAAVYMEKEITCLKRSDTNLELDMADPGYEDQRGEEFYVMADQFDDETGPPEINNPWEADDDEFKITRVEPFPNKKAPLFYKLVTILQT